MKIGIVTTWFARGAAYVSQQYETLLRAHGHEVFIYARGGEAIDNTLAEWSADNVYRAPKPLVDISSAVDPADFSRWLRLKTLDMVIFNEQPWWVPVIQCAELGIRTASYVVEYTDDQIGLYGLYDLLICHTRQHFDKFQKFPQACFVPWGVDTSYFRPSADYAPLPGHTTFVHSSGMNPRRKGADIVVNAVSELWKAGYRKFSLKLRSQVPIWKHVPDVVHELIHEGVINYEEGTFERRHIYQGGDVFLYPARFDGLGLSVYEAQASGLPVISSDFAPLNEFMSPATGLVIEVVPGEVTPRSCYPINEPLVSDLAAKMAEMIERERIER